MTKRILSIAAASVIGAMGVSAIAQSANDERRLYKDRLDPDRIRQLPGAQSSMSRRDPTGGSGIATQPSPVGGTVSTTQPVADIDRDVAARAASANLRAQERDESEALRAGGNLPSNTLRAPGTLPTSRPLTAAQRRALEQLRREAAEERRAARQQRLEERNAGNNANTGRGPLDQPSGAAISPPPGGQGGSRTGDTSGMGDLSGRNTGPAVSGGAGGTSGNRGPENTGGTGGGR